MNDAFQHRKRAARRWRFLWLAAALLALVGIGGTIAMGTGETVVRKPEPGTKSASPSPNNVAAASSALVSASDRDNDGLKDWEEEIYQSDPANPDTDGDGTLDGDEVAANRDPLVRGPNDKITANADTYGSPEQSITARILLGIQQSLTPNMIAALKQGAVAPSDLKGLSNALASVDPETLVSTAAVTQKDITVTNATGNAAAREYFNAVADVMLAEFNPIQGRQTAVFKKIAESGDLAGNLDDLDPVITAYTNTIDRVRAIPVPQEYAPFAIGELSRLTRTRDLLQAIRASGDDPVRAAILLAEHGRLVAEYQAFLKRNSDGLIARGVLFTEHDSGRVFVATAKRS